MSKIQCSGFLLVSEHDTSFLSIRLPAFLSFYVHKKLTFASIVINECIQKLNMLQTLC